MFVTTNGRILAALMRPVLLGGGAQIRTATSTSRPTVSRPSCRRNGPSGAVEHAGFTTPFPTNSPTGLPRLARPAALPSSRLGSCNADAAAWAEPPQLPRHPGRALVPGLAPGAAV